jgi:hypothetical protein
MQIRFQGADCRIRQECWSIGVLDFFLITPSLHYSRSLRLADGTIKP